MRPRCSGRSSPSRCSNITGPQFNEANMPATAMNHFTVLTDDVPATGAFYCHLLGLRDGPRPPLGFDGAWLYAGGPAIVHIVGERPKSELRPGVIDHMAFYATGLRAT